MGNKKILIIVTVIIIITGLFFALRNLGERKAMDSFVQCLAEAGVVIYGSEYCPACLHLVESFGGYEIINPIYIECSEERERCRAEMQTDYVPEIQIKGELYVGPRDLDSFGRAAGCQL